MKQKTALAAGIVRNGKADLSNVSERDREYLRAWDSLTAEERGLMAKHGITGPDLGRTGGGPVNHSEGPDLEALAAMNQPPYRPNDPNSRYFDDPPEVMDIEAALADPQSAASREVSRRAADALMAALCLIADCETDSFKLVAAAISGRTGMTPKQIEMQTAVLLASLNRSDARNQAAIARRYGVCRAAINKRFSDLRKDPRVQALRILCFGGSPEISKKCKVRATAVHKARKERETLWKQTHQKSVFSSL